MCMEIDGSIITWAFSSGTPNSKSFNMSANAEWVTSKKRVAWVVWGWRSNTEGNSRVQLIWWGCGEVRGSVREGRRGTEEGDRVRIVSMPEHNLRIYTIKYPPKNTCLNGKFPSELLVFCPRATDYLTKTLTPIMRIPILNCWSVLSKQLPKYYRLLLHQVAPQDVQVKSPLLKTSCTFQTLGSGASELELIWLPPPRILAFMVLEASMHASKGRKTSTVLLSYDTYDSH